MTINLNQPINPNLSKLTDYLVQVHKNGWYTNFGPLHQQLTKRLETYLGVENLLLVSNGTLALQVAYKTLGVTSALTTPFTFVATVSSLIWQGAEVSYGDIDKYSYNLCPKKAEEELALNPSMDAVIATHVYGNPCDVKAFEKISKEQKVKVIYDAAHTFGVKVDGKSVLNFGDASILSFHATKVFHTAEGGAIIFKHKSDFERAKRLINFGISSDGEITEAGINAKLNEYQCAVGLTILDDIEGIIEHRAQLFNAYRDNLQGFVEMPLWHEKANCNGAYMPITLNSVDVKNKLVLELEKNNIQSRSYFSPSLDRVFCKAESKKLTNSTAIAGRVLCLPLHAYMKKSDVLSVVGIVRKVVGSL